MSNPLKFIIKIIVPASLILSISCFYYINKQLTKPFSEEGETVSFEVQEGEGVKLIAANLEDDELIHSAWWFESEVWLQKNETDFKAGIYKLSPVLGIRKIVEIMTQEEPETKEVNITIIEGWRIDDIAEYLVELGFVEKSEDFVNLVGDNKIYKEDWGFLADAPAGTSLEGYLFPDTYRVFKDATARDIVDKMLANFDVKLSENLRQEITKQNKTIFEVINLASIVQKEVLSETDMGIVAGIFSNRLSIGMALQSDATITYLTGKKDPSPLYKDLEVDSPYNTYQNIGLPPGPISNPGVVAIEATVNPTNSEYLFFLTPTVGTTIFSETLAEHNSNKAKYLK